MSTREHLVECACGRSYNAVAWAALPFVGNMHDPGDLGATPPERPCTIELRNCPCGSTRAVELDRALPQPEEVADACG